MARPAAVEFSYKELADESADLSAKIEQVSGTAALPPAPPLLLPLNRTCLRIPTDACAWPTEACSPFFLHPCQAFGPGGLGICTVSDVPGFVEARQALLPLAAQLAALPDDAKAVLEDPASRYNFGWGSCCCLRAALDSS